MNDDTMIDADTLNKLFNSIKGNQEAPDMIAFNKDTFLNYWAQVRPDEAPPEIPDGAIVEIIGLDIFVNGEQV